MTSCSLTDGHAGYGAGRWPPDLPCKLFPEEYLREVCAAWGQDEDNAQPSKPMRGIGADALSHASRGQTQDEKDVSLRPVFQAAGHKVLSKTREKRRREAERKKERKKVKRPSLSKICSVSHRTSPQPRTGGSNSQASLRRLQI